MKKAENIFSGYGIHARHFIFAILAGAVVAGIFIAITGVNPLDAYGLILKGIFGRKYGLGETLVKATPLILIGLGFTVAFKAGLTNLGGNGQFVMGALAAIVVGTSFGGIPRFLHLLLIGLSAFVAGGLWGGIAGYFKAKFNTNEIIMTIMMNYIALYLMSYLVEKPLRDPSGVLPQSEMVPPVLELKGLITGTRANTGIFVALVFVVLVYIFINRTVAGYKIRSVGLAPAAAKYAGIDTKKQMMLALALSGGLAGLAGMVQVYGATFRVLEGIAGDVGFTAIVVAILAQLNPFGIILAALFIGGLTAGGNSMQTQIGVPAAVIQILQGIIIYFIVIGYSEKKGFLDRWLTRKRGNEHE